MKESGVITPHPDCEVCREREEQKQKLLDRAKEVLAEYERKTNDKED
jgi:predicted nucleic acid-binding Zn ribbon protein